MLHAGQPAMALAALERVLTLAPDLPEAHVNAGFALFELNPAPFCMLDEVDAPLDDANVDRYCETLRALAAKSQMIVITHNKITMEAMELLVGVTMAEAGVSRLVSVDIDQAIEMAAQ